MTEFKKTKANLLTCTMCDFNAFCDAERKKKQTEQNKQVKKCFQSTGYYFKNLALLKLTQRRF